jgi:hypothetical protein
LLAKTPKRKPKSNGQHAPNDAIPYEEAVAEGCKINDQMKRDERHRNMRLGELAARSSVNTGTARKPNSPRKSASRPAL